MAINIADVDQTPFKDISTWVTKGANVFEQFFLPQTNDKKTVININITMALSDGITKTCANFKVTYLAEVIP